MCGFINKPVKFNSNRASYCDCRKRYKNDFKKVTRINLKMYEPQDFGNNLTA
jgi:hypothetical protein